MRVSIRRLALAATCILLPLSALAAQSPATAPPSTPAATSAPLEAVLLAHRLAAFGREDRSPLQLLAAVQLLLDYPPRPLEPADSAAGPRTLAAPDARALLAETRLLVGGDSTLLGAIEQLERRAERQAREARRGAAAPDWATRGARNGPRQAYRFLPPGARDVLRIPFEGARPAVIFVSGDAGDPLELEVFDPAGARIAFDPGARARSAVEWKPARESSVRVEVRNRGTAGTWYVLLTN